MASSEPTVASYSSDYGRMKADLDLIYAIMEGADKVKGEMSPVFLPQYEGETTVEYGRRLTMTPWRPVFEEIIRDICEKPFTEDVALVGKNPPLSIKNFAEDVDLQGNNLHVFAKNWFGSAVPYGMAGVLIDYRKVPENITLDGERALGVRPYWILVPVVSIIAMYVEMKVVEGKQKIVPVHLRFIETITEQNGFGEVSIQQIREFNPGEYTIWRYNEDTQTWFVFDEGPMGLPDIPFVPFFTGKRSGHYQVKPPFANLANMQVELFQASSLEKETMIYVGSPMLALVGASDVESNIQTGPKRLLFSPAVPNTNIVPDWKFVTPPAENIKALGDKVADITTEMRMLGMQPLVKRTGNTTATGEAIQSAKAHSSVQAWAMGLKDALEQAFVFTCRWMDFATTVEVNVFTDFGIDFAGIEDIRELREMRKAGELSRETFYDELKRRSFVGPQFDKEKEMARVEEEEVALRQQEEEKMVFTQELSNENQPPAQVAAE